MTGRHQRGGPPQPPTGWQERAACRFMPTELFFPQVPAQVKDGARRSSAPARRFCRTNCKVLGQCAAEVLWQNECGEQVFGVWAGLYFGGKPLSEARLADLRGLASGRAEAAA